MKKVAVKLTKTSRKIPSYNVLVDGVIIDENVPSSELKGGVSYEVEDNAVLVKLVANISEVKEKENPIIFMEDNVYAFYPFDSTMVGSVWKHLEDNTIYNSYYNKTYPFILEYPFSSQAGESTLQSVETTGRVRKYSETIHANDVNSVVTLNDAWFNKAIIYNDNQSTGTLDLVLKDPNDMSSYLTYPKPGPESIAILYTKANNTFRYNGFQSVVKDETQPLFITPCGSAEGDKMVNQDNMGYYSTRSSTQNLQAANTKIRHILDNRSDICIMTQLIITKSTESYL